MMTLIFVTTKNDMTKTLHFMLDAHYEKEKPYLKHKGKEGVIKQHTFNTVLTESTHDEWGCKNV